MSFENPQSPREVRTVIQSLYDAYASGQHLYPHVRLEVSPDKLPKKTKPAAMALERAWAAIEEDNSFFDENLAGVLDAMGRGESPIRPGASGVIITRIGRNAVKVAIIDNEGDGKLPIVHYGEFRADEYAEEMDRHQFTMTDGRTITLVDGKTQLGSNSSPDRVVFRGSNMAIAMVGGVDPGQDMIEQAAHTRPVEDVNSQLL